MPDPPPWALAAGLPSPHAEEGFEEYVTRLGLDASELTRGLTEETADLANVRLASLLQEEMAADFRLYVQGYFAECVPEHRRWMIEHFHI